MTDVYRAQKSARDDCSSLTDALRLTCVVLGVNVAWKPVAMSFLLESIGLVATHRASDGNKERGVPGWGKDLGVEVGMLPSDEISLLLGLILMVVGVGHNSPLMAAVR